MKFVVDKGHFGEVDVKLHWETKEKINKIFFYGVLPAIGSAIYMHFNPQLFKKLDEE